PIIIDPKGADPVAYDREYVIVLSDWSFMHPHKIFAGLKKMGESFNYQKPTALEFIKDARKSGLSAAMKERAMWGGMRMSPADIADIAGENYTYLINGHGPKDNWTGIFNSGERVRLRFINASAMSIMNVRIPGLEMQVVANDGQNVAPVNVYEFQMGVAETYDVIVRPTGNTPFAIVAESIDRSGMAVATLAPKGQENARAVAPLLRAPPRLTMKDMGHDMSNMDMEAMDHSKMDHSKMGHDMPKMDMEAMDMAKMDHSNMDMQSHNHAVDFGVANTAMAPTSRLSEPGAGLEHVGHKVLNYTMLKSLTPNPDLREPTREIEIHLTSNMERYMWSFNGVKFAHIKEAIKFYKGERIRMYLINDTMMNHPIHLHGMFFQLNNGAPHDRRPNKHTIIVKPGEKLSVDISAEHIGDWAFHCHLLYHMHAGMMQVVSVLPASGKPQNSIMDHSKMDHSNMDHSKMAPSKTGGMK
ncbi:MAG: copper resistance system multicopper oxidase, partial [Robiginitomaculum sp.]